VRRLPPDPLLAVNAGRPDLAPRFFYFHGDWNGGGYYARELARGLPPEQPFFVLHPHGVLSDNIPGSLESMAEDYLAHIQALQPRGPYYLGGYCMAGLIAMEAARRLISAGESVPLLLLVDSLFLRKPPEVAANTPTTPRSPYERAQWLYTHYANCLARYRPAPYTGPVTLLWPTDDQFTDFDLRSYWEPVCPRITLRDIPGNHGTCIVDHVNDLGSQIGAALLGLRSRPAMPGTAV